MNLDIKSVELFIRVAALGAIGKAGLEFGLSPTSASQRIQALEASLGSNLLNRTTRSVSLSADGERFLEHAKRIVANIDDAVTDLQGAAQSIRGELRVTASASFGRRYIAPFIGEFLEQNSDVSIDLELSDGVFDIVQHGFDLALRIGDLVPSTLVARKLIANPRIVVASPEYLDMHDPLLKPNDLARHNCIILGGNNLWGLRGRDNTRSDTKISGNFSTNYGEAITEAALSGVGIALKSKWDILEHLADGTLVEVLQDYTVEPEWSIWAVRPPGRVTPARVRVFTDFVEVKLKQLLV